MTWKFHLTSVIKAEWLCTSLVHGCAGADPPGSVLDLPKHLLTSILKCQQSARMVMLCFASTFTRQLKNHKWWGTSTDPSKEGQWQLSAGVQPAGTSPQTPLMASGVLQLHKWQPFPSSLQSLNTLTYLFKVLMKCSAPLMKASFLY